MIQTALPIGTWDNAQCQGRINEFITQNLPKSRAAQEQKARSLCFGCPTFLACAQNALDTNLTGMVAAGEPLPDAGPSLKSVRSRLRRIVSGKSPETIRTRKKRQPKIKVVVEHRPDQGRCLRCHKTVRPRSSSAAEHPGTVCEHARGLCRTCYLSCCADKTLENYPDKRNLVTSDMPDRCVTCTTAVRPRGTTQAEHPGTSAYAALGMCMSCYRKKSAEAVAS